ncbi:MAG: uracil-DNA glycosylase, partial [archaeon]
MIPPRQHVLRTRLNFITLHAYVELSFLWVKNLVGFMSLPVLHEMIRTCQLCPLGKTRILAVPGEGPARPRVMLIGEAPGRNEDESGRPFFGAAGKRLDALLENAGLNRNDVFITSVVKCRPPNNRVPTLEEATTCKTHYLEKQILLLQPVLIGLMGRTAIQHVLGEPI